MQTEEICTESERSESNVTPRFLALVVGVTIQPEKESRFAETLDRCWPVPIKRNSVLRGLSER